MPLVSDRPTLLLSGDNDPITPPEYAERVIAGGVTNSVHLVAAGQGHGLAGVGCVPRIMRAFLETPTPQTSTRRASPSSRPRRSSWRRGAGAVIEARGLTKQFGAVRALDDVSFSAADGTYHGPARPERRGQIHVPANPVHGAQARSRHAHRSAARTSSAGSLAARRQLGVLPHSPACIRSSPRGRTSSTTGGCRDWRNASSPRASTACSSGSSSSRSPIARRRGSRRASARRSRLRARWCTSRGICCSTSRPTAST